jgi:hypothetical protein
MAPGIPPPQNAVFTSWREIADYLGKSIRTVQRWESEFHLPVRRPSPEIHTVSISRKELDQWLLGRRSYRLWSYQQRKRKTPDVSDGVKVAKAGIEKQRKLRSECCQLMGEVRRNLKMLTEICQTLSQSIPLSRISPSFPVSLSNIS